jgi:hypothetical protein
VSGRDVSIAAAVLVGVGWGLGLSVVLTGWWKTAVEAAAFASGFGLWACLWVSTRRRRPQS